MQKSCSYLFFSRELRDLSISYSVRLYCLQLPKTIQQRFNKASRDFIVKPPSFVLTSHSHIRHNNVPPSRPSQITVNYQEVVVSKTPTKIYTHHLHTYTTEHICKGPAVFSPEGYQLAHARLQV